MSCYPRIRLQSSRRWEARGQRSRETEPTEEPTESDQPVQSIQIDGDKKRIMGCEGSEGQTGPSQPNRQSGKARRQTETETETAATADLAKVAEAASDTAARRAPIMPRCPSSPSLPAHLPSYPRCHALTRRRDKDPLQPGCAQYLVRSVVPVHHFINQSAQPSTCPGNQSSSEQCCHLSLPRFLFPHAPITLSPARQPAS